MATVTCKGCGRQIQDYDKQCLYCNTPNDAYKESSSVFGSFGSSFGSSLGGSSFGSSFGGSFGSNQPTDFGVGKDFLDVDLNAIPSAETATKPVEEYKDLPKWEPKKEPVREPIYRESVREDTPVQKQESIYKPEEKPLYQSFTQNTTRNNPHLDDSMQPRECGYAGPLSKEESVPPRSMSSFFDSQDDNKAETDFHTTGAVFTESEPINLTKPARSQKTTPSAQPSDYKQKLDQYRQANGYGEYSTGYQAKQNPNSRVRKTTYTPSATSTSGGPIDPVAPKPYAWMEQRNDDYSYLDTPASKEKSKKNKMSTKTVFLIIFLVYGGQFVLSFLFTILSFILN